MHTEKLLVTLDWDPQDNPNPSTVESKQHAVEQSGMQRGECESRVTTAKRLLREIPPCSNRIGKFIKLALVTSYNTKRKTCTVLTK